LKSNNMKTKNFSPVYRIAC